MVVLKASDLFHFVLVGFVGFPVVEALGRIVAKTDVAAVRTSLLFAEIHVVFSRSPEVGVDRGRESGKGQEEESKDAGHHSL